MLNSSFRPQNHDSKMLLQETCTSLKTLTKRSAVHGVAADVSTKEGREAAFPIPVQGLESSNGEYAGLANAVLSPSMNPPHTPMPTYAVSSSRQAGTI